MFLSMSLVALRSCFFHKASNELEWPRGGYMAIPLEFVSPRIFDGNPVEVDKAWLQFEDLSLRGGTGRTFAVWMVKVLKEIWKGTKNGCVMWWISMDSICKNICIQLLYIYNWHIGSKDTNTYSNGVWVSYLECQPCLQTRWDFCWATCWNCVPSLKLIAPKDWWLKTTSSWKTSWQVLC